jgi:hypothetical protein
MKHCDGCYCTCNLQICQSCTVSMLKFASHVRISFTSDAMYSSTSICSLTTLICTCSSLLVATQRACWLVMIVVLCMLSLYWSGCFGNGHHGRGHLFCQVTKDLFPVMTSYWHHKPWNIPLGKSDKQSCVLTSQNFQHNGMSVHVIETSCGQTCLR